MDNYYYCKGCNGVLKRKEKIEISYCETSEDYVKLKVINEDIYLIFIELQKYIK